MSDNNLEPKQIKITKKAADRLKRKKKKIKAFLEIAAKNDTDLPKRQKLKEYLAAKKEESASHGSTQAKVSDGQGNNAPEMSSTSNSLSSGRKKIFRPMDLNELKELRARLRERQKIQMQKAKIYITLDWVALQCDVCPQDGYQTSTETSSQLETVSESPLHRHQHLFPVDLQHLLIFALQGEIASYKPRWCKLLRQPKLSKVLVLEFTDIAKEHFLSQQTLLPNIKTLNFHLCIEIISPAQYNSSFLEEIANIPISRWQLKKQTGSSNEVDIEAADAIKFYQSVPCDSQEVDSFSRVSLLLSMEQMVLESYPLPVDLDKYPEWVFSQDDYLDVSPTSPIFSIDCEMCVTAKHHSELTRIAVINERLETVYETLVKPYNTVTDYLTRYSGITKQMLSNVTTRLENVQRRLQEILPPDAILCGQSLNSDLKALKMFHPYVIDTSVIFNLSGLRQYKPSLRRLAQEFLGRSIQNQGSKGHNPIEDALATIELVQVKLKYGPAFGDIIMGGILQTEDIEALESKDASPSRNAGDNLLETPPVKQEPNASEAPSVKQESDTSVVGELSAENSPQSSPKKQELKASVNDESSTNCEDTNVPKKKRKLEENSSDCGEQTMTKHLVFFRRQGTNKNLSLFEVSKDFKKKVSVVAPESSLTHMRSLKNSEEAELTATDCCKDCRASCIKAVQGDSFFTWAQFPYTHTQQTDREARLSAVNRQVKKTLDKCPENVLVVVLLSGEARTTSLANSVCLAKVT